ncbi:MAG: hypothetical protein IPK62_04740 [Bacteroidetes bacterium]|nr:hypothetical protein [Bacteroidota bacterium]MBK8144347.1 hypothetical protein [Bacteroidota bacterium]MBP6314329.1 hypothetical protein [Chitinophagaceae bacterium]
MKKIIHAEIKYVLYGIVVVLVLGAFFTFCQQMSMVHLLLIVSCLLLLSVFDINRNAIRYVNNKN